MMAGMPPFTRPLFAALVSLVCFGAEPLPVYRQATAPVETRVEDLLSRMTAREKLMQVSAHWIPGPERIQPSDEVMSPEWLENKFSSGIGSISPCHLPLDQDVSIRNTVNEFLRTRTRLGIPTFFHDEACHGLMKPEASSFPMPIGLACAWNEELTEKIYDTIAREVRSRGAQHVLTPVVDITLDPRWGRTEETLGEDPFLNARLGAAMVRGFQGGNTGEIDGEHVMATLKHLAGHGAPEGGLNRSPVHVGPIELREAHLAPFAYIIRNAKPATVMPSYNDVDGIPSHANRALLQDLVRGEYGFKGLFVSDYDGIAQLYKDHKVAASAEEAGRLALEAGLQMELPTPEIFSTLEPLLAKDPKLAALVDSAVRAVLRWKFKLGMFEAPALDAAHARSVLNRPETRQLALQSARESQVLLKNDGGLLPLKAGAHRRIAVIGPNAAVARLGGYSGIPLNPVTLLDGIKARVGNTAEVLHAEGCKITGEDRLQAYANWKAVIKVGRADSVEDRRLIAEAKTVAESSDIIILALGENEVLCRESWNVVKLGDRSSLDLFGSQRELAEAMLATGKPVVLYLMNGRPISLGDLAEKVPAIIEGWYAGQEAGTAAAEILFGDVNPSGKLTISFPRSAGHIPAQYRRKPYSAPYTYFDDTHTPLYAFGHGLSYTQFSYGQPASSQTVLKRGEVFRFNVAVTNTGKREGTEIVQVYLRDEVSSVTRPVQELCGFRRVTLKPGETKTLSFEIAPDSMALFNRTLERVIEPGWFTVMVGGSSTQTQSLRFEVGQ